MAAIEEVLGAGYADEDNDEDEAGAEIGGPSLLPIDGVRMLLTGMASSLLINNLGSKGGFLKRKKGEA